MSNHPSLEWSKTEVSRLAEQYRVSVPHFVLAPTARIVQESLATDLLQEPGVSSVEFTGARVDRSERQTTSTAGYLRVVADDPTVLNPAVFADRVEALVSLAAEAAQSRSDWEASKLSEWVKTVCRGPSQPDS